MALRNIKRNKAYSIINIFGLSIGILSCLMLIFIALDELSYDCFHENSKRIFRIIQERKTDRTFKTPSTPSPLGPALLEDYPEIEKVVRLRRSNLRFLFGDNQEKVYDKYGLIADKEIFHFFSFPLSEGNADIALADPHCLVITQSMARICFGEQDPRGQILTATNGDVFRITGIMKDVPENSHLQFNYIIPFHYLSIQSYSNSQNRWNVSDCLTYLMIHKKVDHKELNRKLESYVKEHIPNVSSRLIFQPLTDIHLYSLEGGGPIVYVSISIILAVFILIVACINFINLSTARFGKRSLEVGVRKAMGAGRQNLIGQFFGEALVLTSLSTLLAVAFIFLSLPYFSRLSGKDLGLDIFGSQQVILAVFAVALFTGITSGIYPAFFLSSFSSAKILRSFSNSTKRMLSTRRILVLFQFSISLFLILAALVVSKQMRFIRNKDLGFDKNNLIFFELGDNPQTRIETIKNLLIQNPCISQATATNAPLLWLGIETTGVSWEGKKPQEIMNVQIRTVDFDYLETFKMKMKDGRFFSQEMLTDSNRNYILNEAALEVMGITSPVGKWFSLNGEKGEIIGVIQDFHHHSIHEKIEPVVFLIEPSWSEYIFMRVEPGKIQEAVQFLSVKWRDINPDRSFSLRFFDDELDYLYGSEQKLGRFIYIFSGLALFISCLGLFGLVAYTTEQRFKEIGIRKVLGATIPQIQILLSKDFLKWVLFANVVAWPIAYYTIHKWLQNFAYRISMAIWDYLLAGGLVFFLALLTVSYQAYKASASDPAKSLRYE